MSGAKPSSTTPPRRGEVWIVSFDPSIGGEIQKTRPAVVISNNAANRSLNRVVVAPVSSKIQKLYPGEALVEFEGRRHKVMADQITTASKVRLRKQVAKLSSDDLRAVEDAILLHLGIRRTGIPDGS